MAEIFIITDMGGLQHFQMWVIFARAIPFYDFMPDSIDNEKDCFIKPNERLTLEIDVKSFYGELPAGHYRLIKQFAFFESERDWDYDTYNLSCEFTIR